MPTDAVRLGGNYWRVARQENGTPQYQQAPLQFFAPSLTWNEPTEAQFPPAARQPFSFSDLSGGSGRQEAPLSGPSTQYDRIGDAEGEGVDASLTPGGPALLAGQLVVEALAPAPSFAASGILWTGSGNAYLVMGTTVFSWNGTAFTRVGTLPDTPFFPLLAFQGAQSQTYWYAPQNASAMQYSTDSGVTWNAISGAGMPDGVGSVDNLLTIDGEVVFSGASPRRGRALLASFDDGGSAPTSFAVIDPIGDPAFSITGLAALQGRVFVMKNGEGVFVLSASRRTLAAEAFPELHGATITINGTNGYRVWRGLLWLPTDRGLFAIGPDLAIQQVGPEVQESRTISGSTGLVELVAGDAHNLYALRWPNDTSKPSWLLKAKVKVTNGHVESIVWHDWLQLAVNSDANTMAVVNPQGVGPRLLLSYNRMSASGNDRWRTAWIRLPGRGADPRADPNYRYASAGTLYFSRTRARFPALNKTFWGITPLTAPLNLAVDGSTTTTAQAIRLRTKLDTTAKTSTPPFGYDESGDQVNDGGARVPLQYRGRGLDSAIRLKTTDPTTSPQVQAVTLEYDVEPTPLWQHTMTLDISEGGVTDSGDTSAGDPMTPGQALSTLRALAASGPLTLIDLWDNAYTVTIPADGIKPHAGGPREESNSHEIPLLVDVVAVEQEALTSGSYAHLKLFSYGDLLNTGLPYSAIGAI